MIRHYLQISFPDDTYHKRIERIGRYLEDIGQAPSLRDNHKRISLSAVMRYLIYEIETEMETDGWSPDEKAQS